MNKKEQIIKYRRSQLLKLEKDFDSFNNDNWVNKAMKDEQFLRHGIFQLYSITKKYIQHMDYLPPSHSFKEWVTIKKAKLRIRYKIWKLKHRR